MNKYSIQSVFLFFIVFIIGCKGKSGPEKPLVQVNQAQIIKQSDESSGIPPDTKNSVIRWRGTKMKGLRGHEGTIKLEEGNLFFNDDTLIGGFLVVDMDAIEITDIPAHESVPIRNLNVFK